MAVVFEALAEANRRLLLDLLREGERSVNELVAATGLAQPSVSKHLKALREAGLVAVRPVGQRRWYRLRAEPLRELDAWLQPFREIWADRLDALERRLDTMEDG